MNFTRGPLTGVTVVDLTRALAGPYASHLLAEMGATVVKVEPPPRGDTTRGFGPFINRKSTYFSMVNRGKKSIMLDLRNSEDKEILDDLLAVADVVLENYRPGVFARLGYSWDYLKEKYPSLIYGAVSGFGQTGPYKNLGALDLIVQGMSGFMSVTGHPNSPPVKGGTALGDIFPGVFMFGAICSALYARSQNGGKGTMIDISMLDVNVATSENHLGYLQATGQNPSPIGSRHPQICPFQAYKTKDSYINIAGGRFEHVCRVIGVPELSEDPRFKRNKNRIKQEMTNLVETEMEKCLTKKTTKEWMEIFQKEKIICGPIYKFDEVMADPHINARNMIVTTEDETLNNIKQHGNAIKFSDYPDPTTRPKAPDVDENRAEILEFVKQKSKLSKL